MRILSNTAKLGPEGPGGASQRYASFSFIGLCGHFNRAYVGGAVPIQYAHSLGGEWVREYWVGTGHR
jgi:hypothetical protein